MPARTSRGLAIDNIGAIFESCGEFSKSRVEHSAHDETQRAALEFISYAEIDEAGPAFVAIVKDEIVGCCALVVTDSLAEIEHMWIKPAHMGSGVGRALFTHASKRAAELKLRVLELSADPNAEGFYARMGATRIGEVRADMDGQSRVLPRMRIEL